MFCSDDAPHWPADGNEATPSQSARPPDEPLPPHGNNSTGFAGFLALVSSGSAVAALRLFPLTVCEQSRQIFRKAKMFLLIGKTSKCRLILD